MKLSPTETKILKAVRLAIETGIPLTYAIDEAAQDLGIKSYTVQLALWNIIVKLAGDQL